MNLDTIFDNIDQYDVDSLFQSLRRVGINSFEEFKTAARKSGTGIKKSIQDQLQVRFVSCEDDDWKNAKSINTIESYQFYLDSYPDGIYRDEARDSIEELENKADEEEGNAIWNTINKQSIEELQAFVDNHSKSDYVTDAKNKLKELRKEKYLGVGIKALSKQIKHIRTQRIADPEKAIYDKIVDFINTGKITTDDILKALSEDHNFISSSVANLLYNNGIVVDFSETGIDDDFITEMMSEVKPQKFDKPRPISKITKSPCTEVYFWGIPSSGKSCALGAILSVANTGRVAKSMQRDNNCQGYGYMNRLAKLFKTNGAIGRLPEGTAITSTYEMGFDLEDENKFIHPITCIDLAGELVRCMYKHDANETLTDEQREVLKTLTNVMVDNRTDNRKIHFFVIEYGAEDREYEGLPQDTYLEGAVAYIQRTGIFKKDTDALYIMVTKVDKAKVHGQELQSKLRSYISENYQGFYNGLERICRENEINGKKLEILPFTLGTVCFQNYCKLKVNTAENVVKVLLKRSYGYKSGKLNKLVDKFRR